MDKISQAVGALPPALQLGFAGVGALYIGYHVLSYVKLLLNLFVLRGVQLRTYAKKGTWAVVTGASDGLGKEFATQLAAEGFNLVLVSRTQSKLDALATELQQQHGGGAVETKTLAMDFAQNREADYERLAELIRGLDVGILVNNVGQSHSMPVPFLEVDKTELENMVIVNCLGTLKVTRLVAPLLAQRRKGLIVTMGSFAGWMPIPYLQTYSGSKAFLQHWSSALATELKPSGVDVQLATAYLITGAMSKVRRTSALIPNPKAFVRSTLGSLGLQSGPFAHSYTPWWSHAILQWWVDHTMGAGHKIGLWYNLVMHQQIRTRALRKAARQAKKE